MKPLKNAKIFFACGGPASGGACGGLKPFSPQGIFWCTYWERYPSKFEVLPPMHSE